MTSIKQMPFVRQHKSINHINIKMDKNAIVCRKEILYLFAFSFYLLIVSQNHQTIMYCESQVFSQVCVYSVYDFFFLHFRKKCFILLSVYTIYVLWYHDFEQEDSRLYNFSI